VVFVETVNVGAIGAVGEIQWHGCHRQHFPHAVADEYNHSQRDAGPDEVAGTAAENTLRPRSIDRVAGDERHDDLRRRALHEAIRDNSDRDGHSLLRPDEGAQRAAERAVHQPRCLCGDNDGRGVEEHSAGPMRAP
jgi:hypothetical protein